MRNTAECLYFVLKGAICLCFVPFVPLSASTMLTTVGFLSMGCAAVFAVLK